MEDLSNASGIGTDGDFINGDLVDDQTEIGQFINQDLVQFFQKLANLGGIAFNDLSDNEANGYQLIEALEAVVRTFAATTSLKGTVEKATQAESLANTSDRFIDAELLSNWQDTTVWVSLSLINNWQGAVRVRESARGYIEIITDSLRVATKTDDAFAVLPSQFRTDYDFSHAFFSSDNFLEAITYKNTTPFEIKTTQNGSLADGIFYIIVPKVFP